LTAELAETAEKKTPRILDELCDERRILDLL
jgi:hypothetical protein